MAWEVVTNLSINNNATTWTYSETGETYILSFSSNSLNTSPDDLLSCSNQTCYIPCKPNDPTEFDIDLGNGMHFLRDSSGGQILSLNNEQLATWSGKGNFGTNDCNSIICFVKNDGDEIATLCNVRGQYDGSWWRWFTSADYYPVVNSYSTSIMHKVWLWIQNAVPVVTNWVSVQSLTGQGITIPLSTSTDTNNGEAITTSDTTKFALTAESNINKLIVDRLARGN